MRLENQEVMIPHANHSLCAKTITHAVMKFGVKEVRVFDELPSTNTYAKEQALAGCIMPMLVVANGQTHGKGRFQRTFFSPKDSGIYTSLVLKPETSLKETQWITIAASLAVVDMIEQHYGLHPQIKWLNDVYVHGKKICGILCEGVIDGSKQEYRALVVGIGINTHTNKTEIPDELLGVMTSLAVESGIVVDRNVLLVTLMKRFDYYYHQILKQDYSFLARYRQLNVLIGKTVSVDASEEQFQVIGISDEGHIMLLDAQGREQIKQSGEVSLRLGEYQ